MATEGQFVRATPQRSSRGHYKLGQSASVPASASVSSGSVSGSSSRGVSVEEVRQRALQAAEYYHKTVRGISESDDGAPPPQSQTQNPAMSSRVNGAESGEALRAGVTPTSHDAYYKQKLRDGFIELRNTYTVQGKPRSNNKSFTTTSQHHHHHQAKASRGPPSSHHRGGPPLSHPRLKDLSHRPPTLADRKGLYKSNSSLELDSLDYGHGTTLQFNAARREFGSTSSLDVMSGNDDTFFAMVKEYNKNRDLDQRAPAPPKMQEVLRGRPPNRPTNVAFIDNGQLQQLPDLKLTTSPQVSNGSAIPQSDDTDTTDIGGSSSPKLKNKFERGKERQKSRNKNTTGDSTSGGLFKRLRGSKSTDIDPGSKSPESSSDGDLRFEDRQKRKAFVHFDCQSVGINFLEVIKRRLNAPEDSSSLGKRKNVTTGASAASGVRNSADFGNTNLDDTDQGDGKSNDLVLSCPFFRNEIGGEEERIVCLNRSSAQKWVQHVYGAKGLDTQQLHKKPVCNGIAILDTSENPSGNSEQTLQTHRGHIVEYVDHGAVFYKNFFRDYDHQNYFGVDDNLGPVAVTVRREKLDEKERDTPTGKSEGVGHCYHYRLIVRTSELTTLRGSVLEEAIPSSTRLSITRGLPTKEVLEFVVPELNLSCLKQANPGPKTADQLVKLDEQGLTKTYKIGVMYCRSGQSTEEEMYNNEHGGPAFEEFQELIGQRIRLKGFDKFRGGLDCRTDSTGTESVYTESNGFEMMFHVSTLLPFTANNRQQLLRKRHIGNDIVTIIFQEPGSLPFTPKSVRSHFQHVFIIVRVHNPSSDHVKYSMAVTRSKDVPPFGPAIPDGMMFPKSSEFADFLLTKAINAENAVHRSEKFIAMATRTRQEYLKDLATNYVTSTSLESASKISRFTLGSGRKKEKPRVRTIPDMYSKGALVWTVQLEDFGQSNQSVDCFLAIGSEAIVLVEEKTREVIFTTPCMSVIGWTPQGNSLRVYYDRGECVMVKTFWVTDEEIQEIVTRLSMVSDGVETIEMTLRRNSMGQLGFHVHYEGIVSDVDDSGFAYREGLRAHSRLVEICKVAVSTLTHEQMVDLLRTSVQVKVVVITPHDNGTPRRGHTVGWFGLSPSRTPYTALLNDSSEDLPHRSHSSHQLNNRLDPHNEPLPAPPPRRPLPITSHPSYHSDFRSVTTNLDPRFKQASNSHGKQPSHDSAASRSSGRGSDGHGSEEMDGRPDGYPSDGFTSGDERSRHHHDNYKVTIYPAYSRNSYQGSPGPGPVSPKGSQQSQWHSQNTSAGPPPPSGYDVSRSADSYLNSSQVSSATSYSSPPSAFSPPSQKLSPQGYTPYPGSRDPDRYHGDRSAGSRSNENITAVPLSVTNLSHHSDTISSHSSGHSNGSSKRDYHRDELAARHEQEYRDELRARQEQEFKEEYRARQELEFRRDQKARQQQFAKEEKRQGAMSPGRRRHTVVGQKGRSILDGSPHSSNHSSPQAVRRHLAMVASDENLTAVRLRKAAASPVSKSQPSGKSSEGSRRNFQEDLMRLIDPDLSLTEGDLTQDRDEHHSSHKSGRRRHGRLQRIHRTYSDESMCGRNTRGRSPRHIDPSDVVVPSVMPVQMAPAKPPRNYSHDRLSPRTDGLNSSSRSGQGHRTGSPILPLPDPAADINWNNLVDAAERAFPGGELGHKAGSLGMLGEPSLHDSHDHSPEVPLRNSHTSDPRSQSSKSGHLHETDRLAAATAPLAGRGAISNAGWQPTDIGSSPSNTSLRLQDLEARISQLENDLQRERADKESAIAEVERLQVENERLQEESQTAAAQLRRFTEWFFNTIDKH